MTTYIRSDTMKPKYCSINRTVQVTMFLENVYVFLKRKNAELTKIWPIFLQNKGFQKLKLAINVVSKICSPNPIFLLENHFQENQVIFLS